MVNSLDYVTRSSGIARLPFLDRLLGAQVKLLRPWQWHRVQPDRFAAVIGWGYRPGTEKPRAIAHQKKLPYIALEDGFLRSYGTGDRFAPLSIVVDPVGIYYDCRAPSLLENILNASKNLLDGIEAEVDGCLDAVLKHGLSKYNHAPLLDLETVEHADVFQGDQKRVLVVDQTFGDMSVEGALASAETFKNMLDAASREHPDALIVIKTHPEVSSGRKRGYLTDVQEDDRTVVFREAINPASLIQHVDHVYVVSSTMGFEALLLGKPVTCFGVPWYAGWSVTDDRQPCPRRTQQHTVKSLFAAAYWHYTRYLNPFTHQPGRMSDVIEWLVHQKTESDRLFEADHRGRVVVAGLPRWKRYNLRSKLCLDSGRLRFAKHVSTLRKMVLTKQDTVMWWGAEPAPGVAEIVNQAGCRSLRIEDGFIRSVGLGSDMIRPMSLVLDKTGIYFDATRPSDLENILNTAEFDSKELERAASVRSMIVKHGVTKYNVEIRRPIKWDAVGKRVILVPGQVEDDASIRLGCTSIRTNLGLLETVRKAHPDAFIVYKPHPDVMSGNRAGKVHIQRALDFADVIQSDWSILDCIEACDEVHTLTSLTGLDALLRGKTVVTYGQPFYAGWGLTIDQCKDGPAFARRQRTLTLDQLVAGVLLRYPIYWDWTLNGYTTCEAVLNRIVEQRDELLRTGRLHKLTHGQMRRWGRQIEVHVKSWLEMK